MSARPFPILLVLAAAACTPAAFSPHYRDNNLEDLQSAMAEVKSGGRVVNATGKPMVFLVTKAPTQIIAIDLGTQSPLWTVQAEVSSKIIVGRDLIYFRSGTKTIEARRVRDGQRAWSAEMRRGERLLGIAADGGDLYYVSENAKRELDGTVAYLVALDGATGGERWVRSSNGRLGAPVARDGRVLMPFRFQSVSILSASSGEEVARIRSKQETLSWVRDAKGGMLYGGANGVYRLDSKAIAGTQKESSFFAAKLPASVRPFYWWDGYNPALASYTAYDRNRLLWDAAPGRNGFLGNLVVVHNYRFFFAFDSEVGNLRWVYSYPRNDVVASALTKDALVLVTANGELVVVDPRVGQAMLRKPLKASVLGAAFDVEGYAPATRGTATPDLRRSLAEVIWDPDRRFGAVKLFCVEQLAQLKGGSVAEDLVKIVTHEGIDPAVYKRAGEMIVSRHDRGSIPLYLDTLKSHFNFVEGSRAKAVDIMARALGDLKASEAVRPLLLHLADHENTLAAVTEVVRALIAIGDHAAVEPFRDFLLTYRCDPSFNRSPEALNLVAEGLLKMGGENERQLLSFVEGDANTLPSLRTYLGEALKQAKPGTKGKKKAAKAKAARN
jgi:hypothetical protein